MRLLIKKWRKMKSFLLKEFLLKRVISGHKTETRRTHGLETVFAAGVDQVLDIIEKNGSAL